jgi:Family of unknown function (DUF6152)
MKSIGFGLLAATLLSGSAAFAHHSFSAVYFEEQSVTLQGAIEEFQYRNPHAWVKVRVVEPAGPVVYAAEWAGAGRLERQGITAETLKPGDVVTITGAPGRTPSEYRVHLKRIERPADGWTWGNERGGGGRRRR